MPRTADHEERRRQIAGAARHIALAEGIDRVTVARVAKQAGVSVGLVQHYFPAKDDLVERTYTDLLAGIDQRVADVVDAGERAGRTIREMAADALAELMPLDDARRAEHLARAEFQAMAGRTPALGAVAAEHDRAFRARLRAVVENAKSCGETPSSADSTATADELWASAAGAAIALAVDPAFRALEVLRAATTLAFPDPCQRS